MLTTDINGYDDHQFDSHKVYILALAGMPCSLKNAQDIRNNPFVKTISLCAHAKAGFKSLGPVADISVMRLPAS